MWSLHFERRGQGVLSALAPLMPPCQYPPPPAASLSHVQPTGKVTGPPRTRHPRQILRDEEPAEARSTQDSRAPSVFSMAHVNFAASYARQLSEQDKEVWPRKLLRGIHCGRGCSWRDGPSCAKGCSTPPAAVTGGCWVMDAGRVFIDRSWQGTDGLVLCPYSSIQQHPPPPPRKPSANPAWTRSVHLVAPGQRHRQQPGSGTADPGVVKQDKSSRGSVDTTKTRSGPQRVRMSSGERPIGAAKGTQSDTEALCQPPPPPHPPSCLGLCTTARVSPPTLWRRGRFQKASAQIGRQHRPVSFHASIPWGIED